MVQTLFSANIPRKMRNFAPSKKKCAYLRDPRNSFCSLTFCLIKSKETMTKMTSFPDLLTHLRRGKHSDARQNASSFCGNIVTAVRVLTRKDKELQRPTEYPILQDGVLSLARECLLRLRKYSDDRQSARCYWMEYSHGRQSTGYNCGNTLTADRVLPQFEQTSRRPTEY